jgi:hypothetical protein
MAYKGEDLFHKLVLGFICILSVAMAYAVIETVYGYERPVYEADLYEPPSIPKCDKELWLRIKDGCSESHARPQAPPPAKDGDTDASSKD